MALQDILDRQANSIEYVLHTHGIMARVDGGRLSPRLTHFHIVLPPGVRPTQISPLVPEISEELGVTTSRLAPEPAGSGVFLEVPRPDPIPVRLLSLVQRVAEVVPPVAATLGLDTEGTPLLLRLNAPDVDPVLVSGSRGAGKSRLLRGMALSISLHNSPERVRLLLLDATGDGVAFKGMESLPHLACPVANGALDARTGMRWALRALARRESASHKGDSDELFFDEEEESPANRTGPEGHDPALVIMIDGVERLLSTANLRANAEAADALNHLLAMGSRHDIHMVLSSEHPDLGLEADWGARITGTTLSAEMARMATGMKGSGAQGLLGSGDFLISLNAELIRFQAGGASSADVDRALGLIASWANAPSSQELSPPEDIPTIQPRRQRPAEEPVPLRRSWVGE